LNPQLFFLATTTDIFETGRSLFSLDAQTFIDAGMNMFNFILVAAFLTWLLYKPVKKVLAARAERIENDLASAAANNLSAQELKAEYEQKVSEIEKERVSILDDARKQANEKRHQILDEAKADAQDIKARASKDIAMETAQMKSAVVNAIVDISTDMAARLISTSIDKSAHDKLFTEAMEELEATTAFKADAVAI